MGEQSGRGAVCARRAALPALGCLLVPLVPEYRFVIWHEKSSLEFQPVRPNVTQ